MRDIIARIKYKLIQIHVIKNIKKLINIQDMLEKTLFNNTNELKNKMVVYTE